MKKKNDLYGPILLLFCVLACVSCDKNDGEEKNELIDPIYKTLELSTGYDFEIPVSTDNWKIESVKDTQTGIEMVDHEYNPLSLEGNGTVEAANGWLTLTREKENAFTVSLKENFDTSNPRKIQICIQGERHVEYITIIQHAGKYELVKTEFTEFDELREIYDSDEDCTMLILSNYSSEPVWEPCNDVFKNVVEVSTFESDSYGAFDWIPENGIEVWFPDMIINNQSRYVSPRVYRQGETVTPYSTGFSNERILMPPNRTYYIEGKVTYCKRIGTYTFTVKNTRSGTLLEITGTWSQIVPIVTHSAVSDKK